MNTRPRIVVLDDNEAFAEMVSAGLSEDYRVVTAGEGRAGLELCKREPTALVITDIGMPGMDGIRLLREMKKDAKTAAIPVIVLTATHFNTISRKQFETDIQVRAIFSKPCSMPELLATVQSVLKQREQP